MALIGYKQAAAHVAARIKKGPAHYAWAGVDASEKAGRARALRLFAPGPCTKCGANKGERHHKDGDTKNNELTNVEMLCRRCHMSTDGRLLALAEFSRGRISELVAAAQASKRKLTKCKRGHPLAGENLYQYKGKRICKACRGYGSLK